MFYTLHRSCHSSPIFPNFCHLSSIHPYFLSPFSCSISLSSCSAFPTSWTILSVSSYFSQFLHPSPLYSSFPSFPNLPCSLFTSSCPSLSVACPFLPVHISHFPALFTFPFYLSHLFHFYLLSSLFSYLSSSCPFFYADHASFSLLSFMQIMPPFLCSYFLCPLSIPITPSSQFLPSISFSQFPCSSFQFQLVFC